MAPAADLLLATLLAVAAPAPDVAPATPVIPPFSRRYRTGCTTCHTTPGKLNAQGEAFRISGYRFPDDDERLRHDAPVPLGAEPWKELWPDAIWPGEIPGTLPLALHLLNDVRLGRTADGRVGAGFVFPAGLMLQSATALGDGVAAFAEVAWRPGTGLQVGEVRAMLRDPLPFLPPRALDLALGALRPHLLTFGDVTLDRAGRQLFLWQRLRLRDWTVHRPGLDSLVTESAFGLAVIRPALELNGLARGRVHYGLGFAQAGSANGADGAPTDVYVKLRVKLGGLGFDGRAAAEPIAWGGQFLDRSVVLEQFAHFGETVLTGGASDSHRSYGVAVRVRAGRADLGIGRVWGRHTSPWGVSGLGAHHASHFGRAEYLLYPWLLASLRLEHTRFAADGPGAETIPPLVRARTLPGVTVLLRQNVRLIGEGELYVRDAPRSGPAGQPAHALWLRFDVAF